MRKMKLDLDDLAVETFEVTARDGAGAGTVLGRADAAGAGVDEPKTDNPYDTCLPGLCTCVPEWHTCGESCPESTCPAVGCTFKETECGTCATACPTACTCGESICWPCAVTTAC